MEKLNFDDFITSIDFNSREFVTHMHHKLIQEGCKIQVKEAKSGYVVSYLFDKKTIANYVSRKSGLMVRIYGNHIVDYMNLLETFPDEMLGSIKKSSVCKRLINPDDCNPKCSMGYDFVIHGERYQKCRNSAFMFLVCEHNNPFIEAFLHKELEASKLSKVK